MQSQKLSTCGRRRKSIENSVYRDEQADVREWENVLREGSSTPRRLIFKRSPNESDLWNPHTRLIHADYSSLNRLERNTQWPSC